MRISDWSSDVCSSDLPFIEVLARPLLTPVRVGNWPVEFRVFFGGAAEEDAAISFYYPQADEFEITHALESDAEQARTWGKAMYAEHNSLGLKPWLPRSEESRVGKEGFRTCRSRWSPYD